MITKEELWSIIKQLKRNKYCWCSRGKWNTRHSIVCKKLKELDKCSEIPSFKQLNGQNISCKPGTIIWLPMKMF